MAAWVLGGLPSRRELMALRTLGKEDFTWADLLTDVVRSVQVCVLYFPSRFETAVDQRCGDLLRTFGNNTSSRTSVNFWNPRDENFETALELFGLSVSPAIVLTTGRELTTAAAGVEDPGLYSIAFTQSDVFADEARLISVMNLAHHLMMNADPREIVNFVRKQDQKALLAALGRIAVGLGVQLGNLKPKLGLPGGVSLSIG